MGDIRGLNLASIGISKPQVRGDWYGVDPCFWVPLEKGIKAHLDQRKRAGEAERVRRVYGDGVLRYEIKDMHVPADTVQHNVTIEFWRRPPYPTYGLPPQEFPCVTTHVRRRYRHQHSKIGPMRGALCLFQPYDEIDKRWVPRQGLVVLIELVRRHLFLEAYAAANKGEWLLEEAPHGL